MLRDLEKFREEQINTAPPEQLIEMLLNRSILDIDTGLANFVDRDILRISLQHAQDVVIELRCALDLSVGKIATNLDSLYGFVLVRLSDAIITPDATAAEEARAVLEEVQAGWETVCAEAPKIRADSLSPTPAALS